MKNILIYLLYSLSLSNLVFSQTPTDLVPLSQATHTAQATGNWSDANTWGGTLPSNGAHVVIPNGIVVTVNTEITARLKTLRLDGKLRFKNDVNTELKVETIIGLPTSELEIGTTTNPIQNGVMAKITFIDEGALDLAWDYGQFSKGMVFMGKADIYGFEKTAFATLAVQPAAGANTLTLNTTPIGWQVNDEIVITGTDPFNPSSDEKRTITVISGNSITLNSPLILDHIALASDLDIHVANLSRNIIFRSENATIDRRGHIMFMHTTDVNMFHARTYQLGRTNKRVQVDDWFFPNLDGTDAIAGSRTNIRGRYSIHFHRGGVSPSSTPLATVKGCVVEDDAGWAYVNHSSHVDFLDNVSYNVVGGAFQTEAGDEIGSFKRNIAIRTVNPDMPLLNPATEPVDIREDSQDFAFQGDGFWLHGGRIAVEDNVASGCSGHGFIYWTEGLREADTGVSINFFSATNLPNGQHLPLGSCNTWWAPLISFKGNVTYSATKGFVSFYIHSSLFEDYASLSAAYLATVHSTIEDFTAWNVRTEAMTLNNTERVTVKNVRLENDYTINSNAQGVTNHIQNREMIWENITVRGFEVGFHAPTRGNISVKDGVYSNEIDFKIRPIQLANMPFYTRDLRFDCVEFEASPNFPNPVHFQLDGADFLNGGIAAENFEDINKSFLVPDRITMNTSLYGTGRLYYNEQAANFVPINNSNIDGQTGAYANDILNKTNQQLQNDLGMCFAGAILPTNATAQTGIDGAQFSTTDVTPMNYPSCMFVNESILNIAANSFDNYDLYNCWANTAQAIGGTINAYAHGGCSKTSLIVKMGLEAAYNATTGQMNPHASSMPLTQPYNIAPWNYNGSETFNNQSDIPTNAVDWVLIEIRDVANTNLVVAQQAAILLQDGNVISVGGSTELDFPAIPPFSSYHIVVRHRNHLAIASNGPVQLTNSFLFDCTDSANVLGGTQQMRCMNGSCYLYAGDFNADGIITVADFNVFTLQLGTVNSYINGDANLDGNVTITDFNFYRPNASLIGVLMVRY